MNIIDERSLPQITIFDELFIGDCFMDKDGDICIKTGEESCIYTTDNNNWDSYIMTGKEKVTPLDATLTVKKKN